MLVKAALVAGDIQHADDIAPVIGDRCRGARQEVIGGQVMLVRMDQRRYFFRDGRADGIRAAALFRPCHARLQRHAVGFLQEIIVAQRMHDHAVGIRQDHHIVRVDDLLVQGFHGGQCVRVQHAVLLDQQ